MFKKAKKLPTYLKILLTAFFSVLWILIASNFDIKIHTNWMMSGLVIAWISSVFFGFNTKRSKDLNDNEEKQ